MDVESQRATVSVRPGRHTELDAIVSWHLQHFSEGFFARLGPRFLKQNYATLLGSPAGYLMVAELDGVPVGYVAGTTDAVAHRRHVMQTARGRLAALGALALARRPQLAWLFLRRRALVYARKLLLSRQLTLPGTPVQVGTLDQLVVDPRAQHRGAGSLLLTSAVDEATRAGASRLELVTEAGSSVGEKFYQPAGWVRSGSSRDRDGRVLERWVLRLPSA